MSENHYWKRSLLTELHLKTKYFGYDWHWSCWEAVSPSDIDSDWIWHRKTMGTHWTLAVVYCYLQNQHAESQRPTKFVYKKNKIPSVPLNDVVWYVLCLYVGPSGGGMTTGSMYWACWRPGWGCWLDGCTKFAWSVGRNDGKPVNDAGWTTVWGRAMGGCLLVGCCDDKCCGGPIGIGFVFCCIVMIATFCLRFFAITCWCCTCCCCCTQLKLYVWSGFMLSRMYNVDMASYCFICLSNRLRMRIFLRKISFFVVIFSFVHKYFLKFKFFK